MFHLPLQLKITDKISITPVTMADVFERLVPGRRVRFEERTYASNHSVHLYSIGKVSAQLL